MRWPFLRSSIKTIIRTIGSMGVSFSWVLFKAHSFNQIHQRYKLCYLSVSVREDVFYCAAWNHVYLGINILLCSKTIFNWVKIFYCAPKPCLLWYKYFIVDPKTMFTWVKTFYCVSPKPCLRGGSIHPVSGGTHAFSCKGPISVKIYFIVHLKTSFRCV